MTLTNAPQLLEAHIRINLATSEVSSISDSIEALLGFKAGDFLTGKVSLRNRIHVHDQDIADDLFSIDIHRTCGTFNIRLRQANGRIRCVKGQYTKESDDSSTEFILELLLQDSKGLNQQQSEPITTNFIAMMENTDDYIYFKDRNHVFTGASQTLVSITEPSEHWTDLLGQTDYDVFPEEYADIYYRLEKQVFAGIPVAREIQKTLSTKGKEGWVDNRKYPIFGTNGDIIGLFGIARDITELRQTQEIITSLNEKLNEKILTQTSELLESNLKLKKNNEELKNAKHQLMEREAKLNSIFNAAVEGIITYDLSDIIVSANAAVETIFGYKPEELVGCSISKLMPSLLGAMNGYGLPRAIKCTGQIQEVEGIHKNGSVVPLDLSIAEFSIDNVHYFANIVRDVSLRKHREQQDKKHLDELAHVTRLGLMGEMASGIAHEVNQPLAAISSYTQVSLTLINTEHPDLLKLTEILSKTQEQALRAGKIIHRMREFVKYHAKQRSIADVNALIHDAVCLCTPELKQNDIRLTFELENNLPPIYVDHVQIEQVLINLIRNSVDALQNIATTQPRRLIIQSHLTTNNSIQVRVNDNGPGLNEDQQQKILTPFYTTKTDGMGMGLSISRSLIEAHDGILHFNSELGKGTTFYFTLPIEKETS
ncbi:MAG: PAS domain S-box protein [Methylobacter sp.]